MSDAGAARVQELEEQREFLLGSLRDLEHEHEAGEIDEADYRSLRDDYTARAAAVLRQLEQLEGESAAAGRGRVRHGGRHRSARLEGEPRARAEREPRARAAGRRKPSRMSPGVYVAAVLGTVVVGAGIGVVAFSESGPSRSAGPAAQSPMARRLDEARRLDAENKAVEALRMYDDVLRQDPDNVEALAYRGWLLARASRGDPQSTDPAVQQELLDRALASLDRAIQVDPRYPDAHFFRGMVLFRYRDDPAAAIPEFEAFLANNPPADSVQPVRQLLEEARQAAAATPPASGG